MKFHLKASVILGLALFTVASSAAQQVTDTTGNLLVESRKLLKEKKYADAINVLEKILTRDESNREALHSIAQSYLALDNGDRARQYYQNALKHYPTDVAAIVGMGVTYSNEGKGAEAQNWFEKAVELDSNSVLALTNLGKQLSKNGKVSEALPPLRKAWGLSSHNQDVAYALAGAFATARVNDSAEYYYKASIQAGKETFEAFFYLAVVLHRMGKTDEAIKGYQAAITHDPENKDCLRALGLLYLQTNQFSLAEEEFSRLVALDSTFIPGWQGLGIALALQDQYARADSVVNLLMYIDTAGAYEMLQTIHDERERIKAENAAASDGDK
jgi:tetratricopeptide (TPR) repeat protein